MTRWRCLCLLLLTASLGLSCARRADPEPPRPEPCCSAWYQAVEARVSTGDGRGHGPDLGSGFAAGRLCPSAALRPGACTSIGCWKSLPRPSANNRQLRLPLLPEHHPADDLDNCCRLPADQIYRCNISAIQRSTFSGVTRCAATAFSACQRSIGSSRSASCEKIPLLRPTW